MISKKKKSQKLKITIISAEWSDTDIDNTYIKNSTTLQ